MKRILTAHLTSFALFLVGVMSPLAQADPGSQGIFAKTHLIYEELLGEERLGNPWELREGEITEEEGAFLLAAAPVEERGLSSFFEFRGFLPGIKDGRVDLEFQFPEGRDPVKFGLYLGSTREGLELPLLWASIGSGSGILRIGVKEPALGTMRKASKLVPYPAPLESGQWHRLSLEFHENDVFLMINGQPILYGRGHLEVDYLGIAKNTLRLKGSGALRVRKLSVFEGLLSPAWEE